MKEGQKIKVGESEYSVLEPAASIYNSWENAGRPLPFVYVHLEDSEGKVVPIHVTEIAEVLELP